MIYPTRGAVLAAAAGVPVALVLAVLVPGVWYAALAWPAAVVALTVVDAVGDRRAGRASLSIAMPRAVAVGATFEPIVTIAGGPSGRGAEIALAPDPLIAAADDGRAGAMLEDGAAIVRPVFHAVRRGTARIARAWLRWRGPLGLAWIQRVFETDATVAIAPDVRALGERGARVVERRAIAGLIAQARRGDGSDFDTMVEYRVGMDRRAIDWKQSARHLKLYAKEFRSERNAQVVLLLDASRQMAEPVAGLPRIDRAIAAALTVAWLALKLGDRVALHSFDARPRIGGGFVSGPAAFPALLRLAATIDYGTREANYTAAITTLAARLTRRSMVVLFTELTDAVAADMMLRGAALLMRRHLLLVVVLRDEELEAFVDRAPTHPDDVTRAVTAAGLLRSRSLVLAQLRRQGAQIVESGHDEVGERLAEAYADLKRRDLL